MKYRNVIALSIALIAGPALALDVGTSSKVSPTVADVPTEITLQHEYVDSFRQFNKATPVGWLHHRVAGSFIRQVAPSMTEGMRATIIAQDDAEASLVADLYRQAGAKIDFVSAIDPGAKLVTIKIYQ